MNDTALNVGFKRADTLQASLHDAFICPWPISFLWMYDVSSAKLRNHLAGVFEADWNKASVDPPIQSLERLMNALGGRT